MPDQVQKPEHHSDYARLHPFRVRRSMSLRFFECDSISHESFVEKYVDLAVNSRGDTVVRMQPSAHDVAFCRPHAWCNVEKKMKPVEYTREQLAERVVQLPARRGLDRGWVALQVKQFQLALDRMGAAPAVPERWSATPVAHPWPAAVLG